MAIYLAVIWNSTNETQHTLAKSFRAAVRQRRPNWRTEFDQPGMFVSFQPPMSHEIHEAYPLAHGGGVILGKLFEHGYAQSEASAGCVPRRVTLDERTSAKILADGGNTLREDYWGSYIAFLSDSASSTQWVLRDPTGQIPCQVMRIDGLSVYFVRLADVEAVWKVPLRVNSRYFISKVVQGNNFSAETAYEEVSTVLPGEKVEHTSGAVRKTLYWNAVQIANLNKSIDLSEAETQTRRLVNSCVHAWASCFDSLALQLSGGVDSSIIAACLATSPNRPKMLAVNTHLDLETTDERKFAREVAKQHGVELLEHYAADVGTIDLSRRRERTVAPDTVDTGMSGWADLCSLLNSRGFFAQFRGDGGDELFYKEGNLPDAVDFAFYHGLTPGLWGVAMNDALIGRTSVWEVLQLAIRHGIRGRPQGLRDWLGIKHRVQSPIFTAEACKEALEDEKFWHPLFRGMADCAPAKLLHAYSLLRYTMCAYTPPPIPISPIFVRPLVSQPLMEFSLSTPLHVLRAGARDRARARAAFSDSVPRSVLNRRYKGLFTTPTQRWIREVISDARGLLLDGYLVRERIVDRQGLELLLAKEGTSKFMTSDVLKSCLDCEVWVRDALADDFNSDKPISADA